MNPYFTISAIGYKPLLLKKTIPASLKRFHITGSRVMAATGNYGKIVLQLIRLKNIRCLYSVFEIKSGVTFFIYSPKQLAGCHINMKGNAEYVVTGLPAMAGSENQFNIFYCPYLQCNSSFTKGQLYIILDVLYPMELLEKELALFPKLQPFAEDMRLRKFSMIQPVEMLPGSGILEMAHQLIQKPVPGKAGASPVNLVKKLINTLLTSAEQVAVKHPRVNPAYTENIHNAKDFIDTHLREHYSITFLSKIAGINTSLLKKGFKQFFGQGPFEYLLHQRLTIARDQLEESDKPVKQISKAAGYHSCGNFSTAFKKKFGKSPSVWRNEYLEKNRH
jgi:AraC-like DNA-binding protein